MAERSSRSWGAEKAVCAANVLALMLLSLAGCGPEPDAPKLPTARVIVPTLAPTRPPTALVAPTATSVPAASPSPAPSPTPASAFEQYRAWMEEARALHPYTEPIEKMWAVMICELSGNPDMVSGLYHGLFQYQGATWSGEWNPYREQPILDPRAQIFATARAWQDGNQGWWGCYSTT